MSPTRAAHVAEEFAAADLYVLNGGDCPVGIESVIVDCREESLFLLRPGAIAEAELSSVAGQQLLAPPPTARAPGLLPRHYAPLIPLFFGVVGGCEHNSRSNGGFKPTKTGRRIG